MARQYKLTYFDFTGIGEPIRFLLYYGGIEFTDHRISLKEWPALKPVTPIGQIPTLEFDGKVLYQSLAICRYLASKVGLLGANEEQNWEIDAAVDTVNYMRIKVAAWKYEKDKNVKALLKKKLEQEILPFYLPKFESWATENRGYLATGKLTWADLYFAGVIDYLSYFIERDLLANYPNLQAVRRNVFSIPKIKAWVDRRPVDDLLKIHIFVHEHWLFL